MVRIHEGNGSSCAGTLLIVVVKMAIELKYCNTAPVRNITILIFFFRGEDNNLDEDIDNIDNGNEDKLSQDGIDEHDGHDDRHHDGLQDTE